MHSGAKSAGVYTVNQGVTMSYVIPVWLNAFILIAIVIGLIASGIAAFFVIRYLKRKLG